MDGARRRASPVLLHPPLLAGPVRNTVFLQLIGENNSIWAQRDYVPQDGRRPTTGWLPGEYVIDKSVLHIKPDTPAGMYRIVAGLYDASDPTFPRLPVLDAAGGVVADRVVLATIDIR